MSKGLSYRYSFFRTIPLWENVYWYNYSGQTAGERFSMQRMFARMDAAVPWFRCHTAPRRFLRRYRSKTAQAASLGCHVPRSWFYKKEHFPMVPGRVVADEFDGMPVNRKLSHRGVASDGRRVDTMPGCSLFVPLHVKHKIVCWSELSDNEGITDGGRVAPREPKTASTKISIS